MTSKEIMYNEKGLAVKTEQVFMDTDKNPRIEKSE